MPLDNILRALETKAERLEAEIEQATQAEVERIYAEAQAEAAVVRQKQLAAIEAPLRAEQARILNRAKLEALQIVMGTREQLITTALRTGPYLRCNSWATLAFGVTRRSTRRQRALSPAVAASFMNHLI